MKKCLAIGAGAIGKSVVGYVFSKLGCEILFADINEAVIDDINKRGGYCIHTACQNGEVVSEKIENLKACMLKSEEAENFAVDCDYICTAVGPKGIEGSLPLILNWIKQREKTAKPLKILLFENDMSCGMRIKNTVSDELGYIPEWLTVSKLSIERMTKPYSKNENEFDCMAESFIPVFINETECDSFLNKKELFSAVDDVMKYYCRKLYTNNLGHALLGYMGIYFGYEDTAEAMKDEKIKNELHSVLKASGEMLCKRYGFSEKEMENHIKELDGRYSNQVMKDSLLRLARDPVRKLGADERIIGASKLCLEYGVDPTPIFSTIYYALKFNTAEDPISQQMAQIISAEGLEGVLKNVCKLEASEKLYNLILTTYSGFEY